jgi:hypothetical protein
MLYDVKEIYTGQYSNITPAVSTVILIEEGCTNPGHQVVKGTQFCAVASNIFGSPVW